MSADPPLVAARTDLAGQLAASQALGASLLADAVAIDAELNNATALQTALQGRADALDSQIAALTALRAGQDNDLASAASLAAGFAAERASLTAEMTTSDGMSLGLTADMATLDAQIARDNAPPAPAPAPAPPPPPPASTWPIADRPQPSLLMVGADVPLNATVAYVLVKLDAAVLNTVYCTAITRNGSDPDLTLRAIAGFHYAASSQAVRFNPTDDPWAVVAVQLPAKGVRRDGMWFEVFVANETGAPKLASATCRITFRAAATAQAVPPAPFRRPLRILSKGPLKWAMDLKAFSASRSGFDAAGAPCLRTRYSHGMTQGGNNDPCYAMDLAVEGFKTFGIDAAGDLFMDVIDLTATPYKDPTGLTWSYGASVLTTEMIPAAHLQYGQHIWLAKLPSATGSWNGLWGLAVQFKWPPEMDDNEAPRNGQFPVWAYQVTSHWKDPTTGKNVSIGVVIDARIALGNPAVDLTASFHEYAKDWRPDYCTHFLDGIEVAQIPTRFHEPAYPLMDVTAGGNWGGKIDLTKGSPRMSVRAFEVRG